MRSGQARRSKPPRAHRSSERPPSIPAHDPLPSDDGSLSGLSADPLIDLEEHSFRLPLALPAPRHLNSVPPPPPQLPPSYSSRPPPPALPRPGARTAALALIACMTVLAIAGGAVGVLRAPSSASVPLANVTTATATAPTTNATPTTKPTAVATAAPERKEAPPVAPAPAPSSPPTTTEQDARAEAAHARWEARIALEIGDARRAARVAERATTLDPSEADGWLLLVAAQLDCRNPVKANEALASCVRVATRGPRGECIGMVTGRAARARQRTVDITSAADPPASRDP